MTQTTRSFRLAQPTGCVSFVPARTFDSKALDEDRGGRKLGALEGHTEDRAVICEPLGLWRRLFGLYEPSSFLSDVPDGSVYQLSSKSTERMTERARQTLPVLRRLWEELAPVVGPPLVKLAYETSRGSREHLWFHAHRFSDDRVEATLTNDPWDVPRLKKGDRGDHSLERLTDWLLVSPGGMITPSSQAAARRVRAEYEQLAAEQGRGPSC